MDRGAWQATVHGVARVGHDLVTKPPPPEAKEIRCLDKKVWYLAFHAFLLKKKWTVAHTQPNT